MQRLAVALAACALVLVVLVGQYQQRSGSELVQPSQAVKHREELDEDHAILQSEEESEGIYKHWNAAHNDEIRGDNIGEIHPSSAWHHELFSKAKPVKEVRKHAKVIKDPHDPANNVKFFPLRWMQQQDDPAVTTRAQQGLARTTKLWNAAENDRIGLYNDPVSSVIAHYQNPREVQLQLALRGDGESFVKISRELTLDLDAEGPVQQALRTGQEVVIGFDDDDAYPLCKSMKRAAYAKEFQICFADFVPVKDGNQLGVLEFGVSTAAELNPVTLDATLQMQVQSTTAAFGVYWKTEGTTARPIKTFTSPWYAEQLKAQGRQYTFVDITEQTTASLAAWRQARRRGRGSSVTGSGDRKSVV